MYPQVFAGGHDATAATIVVYWALMYVWIGSEIFLGWRLKAPSGSTRRSDAGSAPLLIASIWLGVAVGIWISLLVPGAAFTGQRRAWFVLGLLLMLAGIGLRWYSIRVLGRWFTMTVTTQSGQTVVETGPYRWIRHPSYTGALVTVLGSLVCLTNPFALLGLLIPIGGYAYRIKVEETVLVRDLGQPYRDYMRRTKRLIPFLV